MKNIKIYCDFINFDLFHNSQIELFVNYVPKIPCNNGSVRFVYIIEPFEIQDLRDLAISMQEKTYDFLLTHDDFLLSKVKNSHLTEFGSCWVKEKNFANEKEYSLSFLCGGKISTVGHQMRQNLWMLEDVISNVPKNFFISGDFSGNLKNIKGYPALGKTKDPLFKSQFHICIENVKSNNFFTEKLIDCFYTKTVPIYWGCPNISEWFDTRGMIIVDSLEDIIRVSQNLDSTLYASFLPYVHQNFLACQKFIDLNEHIKNKITQILI